MPFFKKNLSNPFFFTICSSWCLFDYINKKINRVFGVLLSIVTLTHLLTRITDKLHFGEGNTGNGHPERVQGGWQWVLGMMIFQWPSLACNIYIILIQNTKYRYTFSEKKVKVLLRDYVKYIVNIDHCQAILTFEVLSQIKWLMILQVIFTKYFSAN